MISHLDKKNLPSMVNISKKKITKRIAIAEGMADNREVIFLSKASLEQNFVNELSFCGNDYYIKNANKWIFVECARGSQQCKIISKQKAIINNQLI